MKIIVSCSSCLILPFLVQSVVMAYPDKKNHNSKPTPYPYPLIIRSPLQTTFCWTHYKHKKVVIANFWKFPHFPRLLLDRTHSPPLSLSNISLLTWSRNSVATVLYLFTTGSPPLSSEHGPLSLMSSQRFCNDEAENLDVCHVNSMYLKPGLSTKICRSRSVGKNSQLLMEKHCGCKSPTQKTLFHHTQWF